MNGLTERQQNCRILKMGLDVNIRLYSEENPMNEADWENYRNGGIDYEELAEYISQNPWMLGRYEKFVHIGYANRHLIFVSDLSYAPKEIFVFGVFDEGDCCRYYRTSNALEEFIKSLNELHPSLKLYGLGFDQPYDLSGTTINILTALPDEDLELCGVNARNVRAIAGYNTLFNNEDSQASLTGKRITHLVCSYESLLEDIKGLAEDLDAKGGAYQ